VKSLDKGRINPEGKLDCKTILNFNYYCCGHGHGNAHPVCVLDI